MEDPLVEIWQIHDRIYRYLLDAIPDEAQDAVLAPKHRSVFKLFAPIHLVRLNWLKSAAPALLAGVAKVEGDTGDKATLLAALEVSGTAIAEVLRKSIAAGGKVKSFKPHLTAFLGYLISHESRHRGQIGWTLKASGAFPPPENGLRPMRMGRAVITHPDSLEPSAYGQTFKLHLSKNPWGESSARLRAS